MTTAVTAKQKVLTAFPEAKIITSGNNRFEAFLTIHGAFCEGEEAAWESLAKKIGDERLSIPAARTES